MSLCVDCAPACATKGRFSKVFKVVLCDSCFSRRWNAAKGACSR